MRILLFARHLVLAAALLFAALAPARAQVALEMRNADLESFVQIVAEATGRSFILDPQVQGAVTVIAPGDLSPEALYEIFLNVLELNRLTIVEGGVADRIVPIGIARELAPSSGSTPGGGGFETRVLRVNNAPIAEIVDVIRPLLPPEAVLSTVPAAGLIILSDRRENHARIAALVVQLDKSRAQPIETIRLRNANAGEMVSVLQALEMTPAGASISADRRANALVVAGPEDFRARVRSVVSELDTPQRSMANAVVQLNYADAATLSGVLSSSFAARAGGEGAQAENVSIVADPQTNSLLITAPHDRIRNIVASIRQLDQRPAQVLVEAVIFEMSVEDFADLTAQFGGMINEIIGGGVQFSMEGRPTLTGMVSTILAGNVPDAGSGGGIGFYNPNGSAGGLLAAVASKKNARLLSTPSIMTLNNQEAEIVVAQNVPFVTGSFATVGDTALPETPFQTIERKDVGLTLQVTPQINADNTVRLAIKQEVSNLTRSNSAAGGEITAKRTLSTNVLVRDNNVIMLGGLLENGSGSVRQQVPGLGNLPIFGALFRGKNASRKQSVLLIMLRPRIIRSDREARQITLQVAREAKRAAGTIKPVDDGSYPGTDQSTFPFDGADLNQPFDAGFIDPGARDRRFPPLPSRLRFDTE